MFWVIFTAPLVLLMLAMPFMLWREDKKRLERLRSEGVICQAVIKQIVGRGPNVGITFDIETPSGRVGRGFGGLGDRGYDFARLTDAFATGLTDLFAYRVGLDGFHGVTTVGGQLVQTWLPDFSTAGAVKKGEVELGPVSVALKATKAAAVFRNIKVQ